MALLAFVVHCSTGMWYTMAPWGTFPAVKQWTLSVVQPTMHEYTPATRYQFNFSCFCRRNSSGKLHYFVLGTNFRLSHHTETVKALSVIMKWSAFLLAGIKLGIETVACECYSANMWQGLRENTGSDGWMYIYSVCIIRVLVR